MKSYAWDAQSDRSPRISRRSSPSSSELAPSCASFFVFGMRVVDDSGDTTESLGFLPLPAFCFNKRFFFSLILVFFFLVRAESSTGISLPSSSVVVRFFLDLRFDSFFFDFFLRRGRDVVVDDSAVSVVVVDGVSSPITVSSPPTVFFLRSSPLPSTECFLLCIFDSFFFFNFRLNFLSDESASSSVEVLDFFFVFTFLIFRFFSFFIIMSIAFDRPESSREAE